MRVAAKTEADAVALSDDNLNHLWPLQHAHIIRNGNHFLACRPDMPPGSAPSNHYR